MKKQHSLENIQDQKQYQKTADAILTDELKIDTLTSGMPLDQE